MKKIRKGKILAGGLFALAGIAVGGVGFSSWVVQINQPQTTSDITVNVAETSDKSINIFDAQIKEGKIRFDGTNAVVGDNQTADPRLIYSSADNGLGEDLDFTIVYYVAIQDESNVGSIKATLAFNPSKQANYDNYVGYEYATEKYVMAPIQENQAIELVTSSMNAAADSHYDAGNTLDKISTTVTEVHLSQDGSKLQRVTGDTASDITLSAGKSIPVIGGNLSYKYFECETTFNYQRGKKVDYVNPVQYVTNRTLNATVDKPKLTDAEVRSLAGDLNSLMTALNGQKFTITLTPYAAN